MPDTAWPISRHPPGSSRGHKPSPVSMPLVVFRHVISGSLALAFVIHTCRAQRRDFSATLTTPALNRRSSRWFEASPCRAASEGQTSISCTAPPSVTRSSTPSLLQRSWSHVYATASVRSRRLGRRSREARWHTKGVAKWSSPHLLPRPTDDQDAVWNDHHSDGHDLFTKRGSGKLA